MKSSRAQRRVSLVSLLIGLGATIAVLVAYLAGALDWLEHHTLDLRFRYANSITLHPDVVNIDIDDASLELAGRWPWPRDVQAALIGIPGELGARAVLVDLTYSEAEAQRTRLPGDSDMTGATFGEDTGLDRAFPDLELTQAIEQARPVYLAFHHPERDLERSLAYARACELVATGQVRDAAGLQAALRTSPADGAEMFELARVSAALAENPELDEEALAGKLAVPEARRLAFRSIANRARAAALRRRVTHWLDAVPQRWLSPPATLWCELLQGLTEAPCENDTLLKSALLSAYREVLSYRATAGGALLESARPLPGVRELDGLSPVYFPHARAAQRCGFVTFEPDADGVMRRTALLARHDRFVFGQLAFALACDLLAVGPDDLRIEPGQVTLLGGMGPHGRQIQTDRLGRVPVPWAHVRLSDPSADPTHQRHLPAGKFWEIAHRRELIRQNELVIRDTREQVFATDSFPDPDQYAERLAALKAAHAALAAARLGGAAESARAAARQIAELREWIAAHEQRCAAHLATARAALASQPVESLERANLETLVSALAQNEPYEAANAALAAEIDDALSWLRPRLADKIALVGYTATSLADMTPLPISPRAPGVIAHAHLLSGLLTNQLIRWSPLPLNVALTALLGVLVSFASVWLRPRTALLITLALLALFAAGATGAFYWWRYWLHVAAPLAVALLSYVAIAVFHYIFVERQRRQLVTALSQYTSKAIAAQVADDAELCRRAETREVTCMFTDLRGFTTISERIGAQRTQRVLNVCLGRSTEVLLAHEAMINKFIGDGIFAFWNPVIFPQADHAPKACRGALDLTAALRDLQAEQHRTGGDDVFGELWLRVGVATGNAVVGPCGSEQKYDYTCIGDSVNVAARLESANKFFGTQILVNELTRRQVAGEFEFRALGGVRVKGKQQSVRIYELLGRSGQVDEALRRAAQRFDAAVQDFEQRRWSEALAGFESCLRERPTDAAAEHYLQACREFLAHPPPGSWDGVIELTEK